MKYIYDALVTGVYDGDSITVDIDLGFDIVVKNQKIRLAKIDAPEVRGVTREEGLKTRDYLRNLILGEKVLIKTMKDKKGKYGRYLGFVYYSEEKIEINTLLIVEGLAVEYKK
jgi:micrococcal nuclease